MKTLTVTARHIVDNALDAVVMMDIDGIIIEWNPQAEKTFGWSRDMALGQNLAELIIPPDLRDAHARGLANFRTTHRGQILNQRREFTALRRDGSQFPVELAVTSILTGDEHVFNAFIRDITELKRHQQELEEYAGAVGCDLKKPLGMVMRHCHWVERRLSTRIDDPDLEHIRTAIQGTKYMEQMIDDLQDNMAFGRRAAEPVDCNHVLSRAVQVLVPEIEATDAILEVNPLPEVFAHKGELVMVFQNLISNAIKYRADRRLHIHIDAQRQGPQWRIAVRDNGIGIPANKTSMVFEIFNRLQPKKGVKGREIGLSTCKKAIERRGGSIWVESELGKGSTFYFTLPAVDEDEADE